jgi:hypothetical protein
MVFERLYSAKFLHDRPYTGFLLGIAYTILGLFIALMIFPNDPAVIAVGITSLFLLPSLASLTNSDEITKKTDFKQFLKDTIPHVKVYVFIFFGIFFTFAFFSMFLPKLAVNHIFKIQLNIVTGQATNFSWPLFWDLFTWNMQVLGMCFILSLVAGNGAIVFIAWNASVWGTVFGNLAKTAALTSTANVGIVFMLIILSVLPHTLLEGLSYMISTISGTTLSDGIVKQQMLTRKMRNILVFNLILLLIGVGVLAFGMLVETYVLNNFETYRKIIMLAFPR